MHSTTEPTTLFDRDGDRVIVRAWPDDESPEAGVHIYNDNDHTIAGAIFDTDGLADLIDALTEVQHEIDPEAADAHATLKAQEDALDGMAFVVPDDPRTTWNTLAAINAEALGLSLAFRYAKAEGSFIESRTLAKITKVFEHDGTHVVVGTDPDRADYRAYRVDRMKGYAMAAGAA